MNRQHRLDPSREEEVNKSMAMLKSYESRNPNDITGLLSVMANFLHAFFVAKPVHELAKHMWTLKRQLLHFPYDVNEHSKAIEAIAILFVHSMEPLVEREEKDEKRAKRSIERKWKQWDSIPSQSQSHSHVQSSLRSNELSSDYERPSTSSRPISSLSQPPCNQSGYEETWEESTMDMDEFNLNGPSREETEEERPWEEDGEEMPLLEDESGQRRYSGGLKGRGTEGVRREEEKTGNDREERRYGGGLNVRGTTCTTPCTPSTTLSLTSPLLPFEMTRERRIIVNRERPMRVAIIRRSITTSPGKIILKKVGTPIRREGSSIGMGKANIALENHLLSQICPKSAKARLEYGVDMQGSSFIARSRARASGMMREIDGNGRRNERDDDDTREKGGHSFEETVVESRKEGLNKKFRYTTNPVEATFNSNLSEIWWAKEARNSGATLLSYRLNRTTPRKDDEPILRGRINICEKDE